MIASFGRRVAEPEALQKTGFWEMIDQGSGQIVGNSELMA
jgi:hypothetical protein